MVFKDLKSLCVKLKEELPPEEVIFEEEQAVYEKADALQKLLGEQNIANEGFVRYYKNTGTYEKDHTLGGVALYTPYSHAAEGWRRWRNRYDYLEGRQS